MTNAFNDGKSAFYVFLSATITAALIVFVLTWIRENRQQKIEPSFEEFCKNSGYIDAPSKREACAVYWLKQIATGAK